MPTPNTQPSATKTLSPADYSFLLKTSATLAGPLAFEDLDDVCGTICQQCGSSFLLLGTIDDSDALSMHLLYQSGSLSVLDQNLAPIPLNNQDRALLHQERGWVNVDANKHLFIHLKKVRNHNAPISFRTTVVENFDGRNTRWFVATDLPNANNAHTYSFLFEHCAELLANVSAQIFFNWNKHHTTQDLDTVLNTSDSVYATWHEKAGWQYHNINGLIALGYDKKNIDISWIQQNNPMHPDDWQATLARFHNLVENGEDYQHEYRATSTSGEQRWYQATAILAESNTKGGASFLTSISRDITTIKRAELEAKAVLDREQWLTELTQELFSSIDFKGFVPALKKLGDYMQISRCCIRVIDPATNLCNLVAEWYRDDQTALAKLFPEMTSQTGFGWMERLITLGDTYVVNCYKKEVPNQKLLDYYKAIDADACVTQPIIVNNKLIGYLAILDNNPRQWTNSEIHIVKAVTDTLHMAITRNRLLDDLRESEERIQLAMQNSVYSLWDHDLIEKTLYISPHLYTSLGYDVDEVATNPTTIIELTHPDDRPLLRNLPTKEYLSETGKISLELRLRRKDGSFSWILTRGKVVARDKNRSPTQIMGINLEINDIKETQSELRTARERAEEANHSKSEFLERMSHEIRTPMNAILGMSYLALDSDLNHDQRVNLEDVEKAAKSLLHVIDDILDFSKIESGELTICNQPFDIRQVMEKLVKLQIVKAEQANNTLELSITDEIPTHLLGDANRIGQVITNLLSNAIKFTKNGVISMSVQQADFDANTNNLSLLFSVSDSGIGLTEPQLNNLFQPFTQAEGSTTRKYGGTGLGLSICKHLVEMMGGSIHAISLPNVGTTFHFTITCSLSSHQDSQNSVISEQPSIIETIDVNALFRNKKVLLTEDNIVNQRVAQGILKKFNIEVCTANNGQETLTILQQHDRQHFDAVLMDIEMPVLDGLSATKAIRAMDGFMRIPIVAMTAHAMVGDKERCLEAGMSEHIPKPIDPQKLKKVLCKLWQSN